MNGSCDLDPIMGDFINFCKPFLNEGWEKKILLNNSLEIILLFEDFHNSNEWIFLKENFEHQLNILILCTQNKIK
jgi:hypothetical protein